MRSKLKRKKKSLFLCLISVALLLAVGVFLLIESGYLQQEKIPEKDNSEVMTSDDLSKASDEEDTNSTEELSDTEKQINLLVDGMSIEEKVYQMMFVTPEALTGAEKVTSAGSQMKESLRNYPVGGVIFFSQNITSREQVQNMTAGMQEASKIPLFIGVDEEGGIVSRLGSANIGVTKHPSMKEVGDSGNPENAYNVGYTIGKEIKELGFNVDFAPVADILINLDNKEIGDRAFGTTAETVSVMVPEFVKGMEENHVSATLKHFPGGGSSYVDSHTGYSESTRTMEELRSNEFVAFSSGIDAGADFVMISHITPINAIQEKVPASLSKEIITNCLREELGFEGIIITDSFQMGAITDNFTTDEAVVKAVNAGVDMILMPVSIKKAHSAIVDAVKNGTLTEERINESVGKILTVKFSK